MSNKATTSKNIDPRLPPLEAIVTRHKSAQMKRQLRKKDQSIRRISEITQLLRSPTGQLKSPTSAKQSSKSPIKAGSKLSPNKGKSKSPKKVESPKKVASKQLDNKSAEYYPNKIKRRTVEVKKNLLKPKPNLTIIGATKISRRKRNKTQTGSKSPSVQQKSPSLESKDRTETIADLIRLAEESQSLDDDDLMEILTCPSPVWWEDPPDIQYNENAILTRSPTSIHQPTEQKIRRKRKSIARKLHSVTNDDDELQSMTDVIKETHKILEGKQPDKKFMSKRNKLEDLLGNIKNKISPSKNKSTNNRSSLDDNELIPTIDDTVKTEINENVNKIKDNCSESTENDDLLHTLRDYEMLNDLENIDIPIEQVVSDVSKTDNTSFLDSSKMRLDSIQVTNINDELVISCLGNKDSIDKCVKSDLKEDFDAPKCKIPTNLPKLHRNPLLSVEKDIMCSPLSLKSLASDDTYDSSSAVSNHDQDTISDTNIRFIDDEDSCSSKNSEVTQNFDNNSGEINNDKKNKFFLDVNEIHPKSREKSDCMLVYKIITNDSSYTAFKDDKKISNILKSKHKPIEKSKINKLIIDSSEYKKFNTDLKLKEPVNTKLDILLIRLKNRCQRRINKSTKESTDEESIFKDNHIDLSIEKNTNEKENKLSCEHCSSIKKPVLPVNHYSQCTRLFETEEFEYCRKKGTGKSNSCQFCKLKYCCVASLQIHEKSHQSLS